MVSVDTWQNVLLHWERLLFNPWIEKPGPDDCAFCQKFVLPVVKNYLSRCNGCPIYGLTGERGCEETPYFDAAEAWEELHYGHIHLHEAQKSIFKEYKFLVKLYREAMKDED